MMYELPSLEAKQVLCCPSACLAEHSICFQLCLEDDVESQLDTVHVPKSLA